jgi:plastocyanin
MRRRPISPSLITCMGAALFTVAMLVGATIGDSPISRPVTAQPDDDRPDDTRPDDSRPDDSQPDDSQPGDSQPDEAPATIVIADFDFQLPAARAGQPVEVTNLDGAPHSATDVDGNFDSGILNKGQTSIIAAPAAGSYEVFCTLHPSMKATWEVQP